MVKRRLKDPENDNTKKPRVSNPAWPTAEEIGDVFMSRTSDTSSERHDKVDIFLPVMPYNSDASIYGSQFEQGPMFVMHLIHNAKPSVFFKFYHRLTQYIAVRHKEDAEFPETKDVLEQSLGCKFVFTKGNCLDEDEHNLFKPWRIAIYMTGNMQTVKEIVIFIDAFVHWVTTEPEIDQSAEFDEIPKIHVQIPADFDLKLTPCSDDTKEGDMECPFAITKSDNFTVKVTDAAPPCFPCRMLIANIEVPSKQTIVIVWCGNTIPFREGFEKRKIGGKLIKVDESARYGEYFRKSNHMSIHDEEGRKRALELFEEDLTKNSPMVVRVRSTPNDDDAFQHFMESLKKMPHCVFL